MFCSRNEEPNTSHQLANCQVKIDLTPDTPDTPDTLTHITLVYLVTRSGRLPALVVVCIQPARIKVELQPCYRRC